jgi:hypothetical protein
MSVVNEFRDRSGGGSGPPGGGDSPLGLALLGIGFFGLIVGGAWAWNSYASQRDTAAATSVAVEAVASRDSRSSLPSAAEIANNPHVRRIHDQVRTAAAPSKPGERIGARARATFLAKCLEDVPVAGLMMGDFMTSKPRKEKTPEQHEAVLTMIDQYGRMPGIVGMAGTMNGKPADVASAHSGNAEIIGDFVACAVVRPAADLCNPDNRAAALAYLNSYFTSFIQANAAWDKLSSEDRRRREAPNTNRHTRIENAVIAHARGGSLAASDISMFGNARLKELLGTPAVQPGACRA